ncbi:MAG: YcaQ family DNA glycosylase [Anaerolineales bacterium]|nr:YcaQ family DNA glycosylase [Anaerolineales bacterium]
MAALRTLSTQDARRLAITRQHLTRKPKPDLLGVIRDLGCVQLDPIRAVERTHWLVLWSRLGPFNRNKLHRLRWRERALFEYWAHAASLVLTEEYPLYAWRMAHYQQDTRERQRYLNWLESIPEWQKLESHILERLHEGRENGVLSREIEDHSDGANSDHVWWSGRYVPRLMDYLWTSGKVMVVGRDGLQRRWGLASDFFPEWTPQEQWSDEQVTRYSAQRAIRALGVATAKQIKQHYTRNRYPGLEQQLTQMTADGILEEITVQGKDGELPGPWYLHREDAPVLEAIQAGDWQPRTTLLSPFDNLICDRDRTEALFDFFYRIEIYVPKAKREFGYYVLPILAGDELIGRVDPTMDRANGTLTFHNVYAEPGASKSKVTVGRIRRAMESLGKFLEAEKIVVENVPAGWEGLK